MPLDALRRGNATSVVFTTDNLRRHAATMVLVGLNNQEFHAPSSPRDVLLDTPSLRLAEAIDSLPPKERVILALLYFEDLQVDDICEVLSITPDDVINSHSSAIAQVRELLQNG